MLYTGSAIYFRPILILYFLLGGNLWPTLALYVCIEGIFNKIFLRHLRKCSPLNKAYFVTFCVQIGQSFQPHSLKSDILPLSRSKRRKTRFNINLYQSLQTKLLLNDLSVQRKKAPNYVLVFFKNILLNVNNEQLAFKCHITSNNYRGNYIFLPFFLR